MEYWQIIVIIIVVGIVGEEWISAWRDKDEK